MSVEILSKTLSFLKAATTIIKLKSNIKTLKSICEVCKPVKKEDSSAKQEAITSTISFLIQFFSVFKIIPSKFFQTLIIP